MAKLKTTSIVLAVCLLGAGAAWAAKDGDGDRDRHGWRDGPEFAAKHAEMCKDLYAREVGRTAYLEARLQLTAAQQSLFDTWKNVVLANAGERSKSCTAMTSPAQRPSILDMMQHEQMRLQARLAALQAEMPALTALYQSLSPEQQRAFMADSRGRGPHERFGHDHDEHDGSPHDGPPHDGPRDGGADHPDDGA
jgi:hypothetical protein